MILANHAAEAEALIADRQHAVDHARRFLCLLGRAAYVSADPTLLQIVAGIELLIGEKVERRLN